MRRCSLLCVRLVGVLLLSGLVFSGFVASQNEKPHESVVSVLTGHDEPVYSVTYSPDGKYVVTGSFDKSIKVWHTKTGKVFKSFGGPKGHRNLVLSVDLDPVGALMATGASDNTAKLWDFPSSSPIREFAAAAEVLAVAQNANGSRTAVASKDGIVKVYQSADGKELFQLKGHTGPVTGVAYSRNNAYLVTSGEDRTIRFWNPNDGKPVGVYGAHERAITSLLFHPSSSVVYSGSLDGTVKFWSVPLTPTRKLATPHGAAVADAAFNPNRQYILSVGDDKSVAMSNFSNGTRVRAFTGATGPMTSIRMSANNALLAAGTKDRRFLFWNANQPALFASPIAHEGSVSDLSFHPGSSQLLTVGGDGALRVWTLPLVPEKQVSSPDVVNTSVLSTDNSRLYLAGNDKTIYSFNMGNPKQPDRKFSGHTTPIRSLGLAPNNTVLASGGDDGIIRLWNPGNSQALGQIGGHTDAIVSLGIHPNNTQFLSGSKDGTVKLWQLPVTPDVDLTHPAAVTKAVLSPDGNFLLTGSADKLVRTWNLGNKQPRNFSGLTQPVSAVAYSRNNAQVAGGSAEKAVIVWTAGNGQVVKKVAGIAAGVTSLAFNADGKLLAVGMANGQVALVDVAMGKVTKTFPIHKGAVTELTYNPAGNQLVSGGADGSVIVSNPADGKGIRTIAHGSPVSTLTLSKDGTQAVSAGADKVVKVWTLADGKNVGTITTAAPVTSVSLSPDTKRILVGGADNHARLYSLDGTLLESRAHAGPVAGVAFHSDNKRLVSASADKLAKVWTSSVVWATKHPVAVRSAKFSGNGGRIATCSADKVVRILNPADGVVQKELPIAADVLDVALDTNGASLTALGSNKVITVWTLPANVAGAIPAPRTKTLAGAASSVATSPDGKRLSVDVSLDGKVRQVQVFDIDPATKEIGAPLQVVTEHAAAVSSLAFGADNRTVVSSSQDKTVRLSNLGVLRSIDAHKGGVTSVDFHSNGTQALTAGADKTVKLWNLTNGQVLKTFGPLTTPIQTARFSRDYSMIAAASAKAVVGWNVGDGKQVMTLLHPDAVTGLAFNSNKTQIVTGCKDNSARVWDVAKQTLVQFFPHDSAITAVDFHTNNQNVIAGGADKTVSVHTLRLARTVEAKTPVLGLGMTANASHLITSGKDKSAKLWNAGNGNNERTFVGSTSPVRSSAIARNNVVVATGSEDKKLRLYDFNDAKLLMAVDTPGIVNGLTFNSTNSSLVGVCDDGSVVTWNVVYTRGQPLPKEFGTVEMTFRHSAPAHSVALSPDNLTIYSASSDKTVKAWKNPRPDPIRSLGHPNLVDCVTFSPDGKVLATGCHDGRLRLYDVEKGNVLKQVDAHTKPAVSPVYCVTWSPDGKYVLTGSLDHSMKLWDGKSGAMVREFKGYDEKNFPKGHRDGIFCVAFSPDGKFLASGSSDRTIKIWDVATGQMLRDLVNTKLGPATNPPRSHPGWVYGVKFTADGKYLYSIGGAPRNHGYLALWSVGDGKLVKGENMNLGTFYSLAVAPDGKTISIGTGASIRNAGENANASLILKPPTP